MCECFFDPDPIRSVIYTSPTPVVCPTVRKSFWQPNFWFHPTYRQAASFKARVVPGTKGVVISEAVPRVVPGVAARVIPGGGHFQRPSSAALHHGHRVTFFRDAKTQRFL